MNSLTWRWYVEFTARTTASLATKLLCMGLLEEHDAWMQSNTSENTNAARFMNDTDIWSRVTCSMAKEVGMCIYTTDGNSTYMNLIPVRVNYVWKMNLTFKYPQLHNILSQTYIYTTFLTGNNIKETRLRIYWHIIAGSLYTAKWYIVYLNCSTTSCETRA